MSNVRPHTVILARHGWWWGNPYVRSLGRVRSPLPSPEDYTKGLTIWRGHREARQLGNWVLDNQLDIDTILTSPYKRARQTALTVARIAVPHLADAITVDDRLQERSRGTDLSHPDSTPLDWLPDGGETLRTVGNRLVEAIDGHNSPDCRVLLISGHGELMVAGRGHPELGNLDNERLVQDFPNGMSGTRVGNCGVDRYTSVNPQTGEDTGDYNWMRFQQTCGVPLDTGWMSIER